MATRTCISSTTSATGTSFDVLVTEGGRVEVLPGFQPSVGSLARVTDAIGVSCMKELYAEDLATKIPEEEFFGA